MPLETATYINQLDKSWPLGGDPVNQGDDHIRVIKSVLKATFPGSSGQGFNKQINCTEDELNRLVNLSSNAQTQLNGLSSRISSLENHLTAPSGTKMVFYQASAPTGWTKQTLSNTYMLRMTNTGGVSGGVDNPVKNDKVPYHNHTASSGNFNSQHSHNYSGTSQVNNVNHTHGASSIHVSTNSHTHSLYKNQNVQNGGSANTLVTWYEPGSAGTVTDALPSSGAHTHSLSGSTQNQSANHTHTYSGSTDSKLGNHNHTVTVNYNAGASNWEPRYLDCIIGIKD